MGLFNRILGKGGQSQTAVEALPCPHTALIPRWQAAEDMGKQDKVSTYTCQGCNQTFTAEEAQPFIR